MMTSARDEEVAALAHLFERFVHEVGGTAQRPGEVGQEFARLPGADLPGRDAYRLRDDVDPPLSGVVVGRGERYTLALLVDPHDHELAGKRGPRHARSLDPHPVDAFGQQLFFEYFVHIFLNMVFSR